MYTAKPDKDRAKRIAAQLPKWWEALFDAVFLQNRTAQRLLERLQDEFGGVSDKRHYLNLLTQYVSRAIR